MSMAQRGRRSEHREEMKPFSRGLCAPADLRFTGPVLVCKRLRNQEENHTGHAAAVETQTDSRPQVLRAVWGEGNPVLYVLLSGNRTRRK